MGMLEELKKLKELRKLAESCADEEQKKPEQIINNDFRKGGLA